MSPDLWVLLTAVLAAVACGVIGSFLVLRQHAMLGDAISHSVLPGLVVAFLVTSSRGVIPMIIGAAVMGLATAYLTDLLDRTRHVYRDGALGIVFTFLFAVGVILIALYADQIDLDQDCVLYGEIAYTPWDLASIGGQSLGPRAVWILGGAVLANIAFIVAFYKQLKISSFDPSMARAVGLNERLWHYLLMTMISLTVVAAFESVGAILVVAMLIVPGATAYLLTHRLSTLLVLSGLIGAAGAVGGFFVARALDASISGSITVVSGIILAVTMAALALTRRISARRSAKLLSAESAPTLRM